MTTFGFISIIVLIWLLSGLIGFGIINGTKKQYRRYFSSHFYIPYKRMAQLYRKYIYLSLLGPIFLLFALKYKTLFDLKWDISFKLD